MNKKRIIKIFSIALMVVMIAMCLQNIVFADMPDPSSFNGAVDATSKTSFNRVLNAILGIAQIIGVAVAVIMLIVLAIKYISAAPSDKADIKKHAVIYIVGAVVLFGASGLLGIVKNFSESNLK